MKALQIQALFALFDRSQKLYGDKNLSSIYGAGCINKPKFFLVFINPTARNVSSDPNWRGIRAPWLGTKHVWKIFYDLGFINKDLFKITHNLKISEWNGNLARKLYMELANNEVYVTNFAKCTQIDARPLSNAILKKYLRLLFDEVLKINPVEIIAFGSQVSSLLLGKPIRISNYDGEKTEMLSLGKKKFRVHPIYYPVGQGMRNMKKAIETIKRIRY